MPGLAHRLSVMLGLMLIVSLAMPELADSRHKRPQRRSGTAEFTNSFVEAGLQPRTFTCEWAEVLHDYMCSPSPGPDEPDPDDPLPEWNDPPGRFKLKTGLARADRALPPEPPPGQEWKGLASREAARVFTCTYDGSGPLSAANYMCSYSNPQLHTFTAAEIVSVCDDERLSPARLSFCADDHKPLWTQDPNDELDDDRALRNIPVEDYVECDPPVVPESGACPERLPPEPRDDYEQPGVGFFELDSWYPPDTTAPDTAVTAAPSGTVASPDATLGFISSEDDSSFECRLGGSAWEECGSPEGYTDLEDGGHSFEVRATDSALNLDPLPAGVTFTVDTTGPRIRISGRRVRLTTRGRRACASAAPRPSSRVHALGL